MQSVCQTDGNSNAQLRSVRPGATPNLPHCVRFPWGGVWLLWNDALGNHIRQRGNFEPAEQNFLLRFLQPGMNVLDIGAHHGLYTLLSSVKVGPKGRVIAFEPSPREFQRLKCHLALNRCCNVTAEPVAVGECEGSAELFVCLGVETGCNSMRPPAVADPVRKIPVPVTTLDAYLERSEIESVDFIKIDVEGAELGVLKGGSRVLEQGNPLILCEVSDVRTAPWGYASVEIVDFLADRGYRWFSIGLEGNLIPCPKKSKYHENLAAVHEKRISSVTGCVTQGAVARGPAAQNATINLLGDRSIEWSWVVSQMPHGPGEALDFGSGSSDLGFIAAQKGFNVIAVDLRQVCWPYVHPALRFLRADILKTQFPRDHFDLVINCSTVEHVGLSGRYGVTESRPDGDLEAMARLRRLMRADGTMLLTIPVGQDELFVPLCRVYGPERLPKLLEGFEVEKEAYWVKDSQNRWVMCGEQTALSFKASVASMDPMQNVYALGCFVLRRSGSRNDVRL